MAIEQYHDFYAEGTHVIALDAITSIRTDSRERHFERILRAERLRPRHRSVMAERLASARRDREATKEWSTAGSGTPAAGS